MDIAANLTIRADREQLYRVLSNLLRNARQAIEATGEPGTVEIAGGEDEASAEDRAEAVRLRQRVAPLIDMLKRSAAADVDVVWGV